MNAQFEMDRLLNDPNVKGKTLLLHACCAPCSSYVLTYLRSTFRITVLYFNPNITAEEEYRKRATEEKRFIDALNSQLSGKGNGDITNPGTEDEEAENPAAAYRIEYVDGRYEPAEYMEAVKGYEDCPERGERCTICFRMRLGESAKYASENGFDFFATTLTLSPLKNTDLLNQIGLEEGKKYKVAYLPSDFKKKGGYQRSIELSKEYGLYRQDFCGCAFSKAERIRQKAGQNCRKVEQNSQKAERNRPENEVTN